jgi:hypothetical protein
MQVVKDAQEFGAGRELKVPLVCVRHVAQHPWFPEPILCARMVLVRPVGQ